MNLIEQSEEVAREMERIRSFRRKVNRRTTMRQFAPRPGARLVRSQLRFIWQSLRKLQWIDFPGMTRMELELLCSEDEKASPFYGIILCGPDNDLHVTGEHLHERFPAFDWPALEGVTRIRVGQVPGPGLAGVLDAMRRLVSLLAVPVAFLAALGVHSTVELHLRNLDMADDRIATGLSVLTCLLVVYLAVLVTRHRARKRLQGTLGILGYMAILARQGHLPSARD